MPHWTEENADAFAHKLAFDFIAQVEKKIETLSISQTELAQRLGVSEGAVSKVLNNPQNLTLKTIAKYARVLGIKAAIVAYDDNDPNNEKGLVNSEIFTTCWEYAGKPRDVWALENLQLQQASTEQVVQLGIPFSFSESFPLSGYYGLANSTFAGPVTDYGVVCFNTAYVFNAGVVRGASVNLTLAGKEAANRYDARIIGPAAVVGPFLPGLPITSESKHHA